MNERTKNPAAVELGRLGGLAGRGACKARKVTREQAQKAARARWDKARKQMTVNENNK